MFLLVEVERAHAVLRGLLLVGVEVPQPFRDRSEVRSPVDVGVPALRNQLSEILQSRLKETKESTARSGQRRSSVSAGVSGGLHWIPKYWSAFLSWLDVCTRYSFDQPTHKRNTKEAKGIAGQSIRVGSTQAHNPCRRPVSPLPPLSFPRPRPPPHRFVLLTCGQVGSRLGLAPALTTRS